MAGREEAGRKRAGVGRFEARGRHTSGQKAPCRHLADRRRVHQWMLDTSKAEPGAAALPVMLRRGVFSSAVPCCEMCPHSPQHSQRSQGSGVQSPLAGRGPMVVSRAPAGRHCRHRADGCQSPPARHSLPPLVLLQLLLLPPPPARRPARAAVDAAGQLRWRRCSLLPLRRRLLPMVLFPGTGSDCQARSRPAAGCKDGWSRWRPWPACGRAICSDRSCRDRWQRLSPHERCADTSDCQSSSRALAARRGCHGDGRGAQI